MAKKVRFIAPVEVMQGNLSGKQDLKYPSNDNKAYEAPAGVNYARNYTTRYIGAYRAKDGLKYFAVKQRSAIKISASSKLNMALLGATASIIAVLKKDTTFMGKMGASLVAAKAQGYMPESATVEDYMRSRIRTALASKVQYIAWGQSGAGTPVCTNPFVYVSGASQDVKVVELSAKILREFWGVLATSPVEFKINSALKAIAHSGDTFGAVATTSCKYNVLHLSTAAQYIVLSDSFEAIGYMNEGSWTAVGDSTVIDPAVEYITQTVQP